MLLSLVRLISTFLILQTKQANEVTLIIMQISVFSSTIPQCMASESFFATAIMVPLLIVAY